MITPSPRAAIDPFLAMEIAREANTLTAAGRSIIRLDVGQPAGGAPPSARAAASAAVDGGILGYTEALGLRALRAHLSDLYARRYGVSIAPERFIVTTGSSGGFLLAFLAVFGTGARVLMASPGYPPYRHILTSLGMEAVVVEASAKDRYQLAAHHIEAAKGPLDGVLIATPANPTGTVLSGDELCAIHDASAARGATLIVDEIYHGLAYGSPTPSILETTNSAIVISSFSKFYAMTGWRIGWLVVPEELIKPVERLAQNLFICPPHVSQVAALAALDDEADLEARKTTYAANRNLVLAALPGLGITEWAPADGAFYVYANISAHTDNSVAWCERALHEAGVALTAGLDFDATRGHHWVRIAYAGDPADITEGLARLKAWLGR